MKITELKEYVAAINADHEMRLTLHQLNVLERQINRAIDSKSVSISHLSADGEDLRQVAFKYYGDMSLWRPLASYNRLSSSSLSAGVEVIIPKKDDLIKWQKAL